MPNTCCKICLTAALGIQILLCIGFETWIALKAIPTSVTYWRPIVMMQIQLATVLFEACYQLVLALHAIRMRNIVTAIGVCINNSSMLIFVTLAGLGIDRIFARDGFAMGPEDALIVPTVFQRGFGGLVGAIVLCTFAMGFVTYKLYGQFACYPIMQTYVFYD